MPAQTSSRRRQIPTLGMTHGRHGKALYQNSGMITRTAQHECLVWPARLCISISRTPLRTGHRADSQTECYTLLRGPRLVPGATGRAWGVGLEHPRTLGLISRPREAWGSQAPAQAGRGADAMQEAEHGPILGQHVGVEVPRPAVGRPLPCL